MTFTGDLNQPTNQPTNCNLKLTKLHTTNDLFLTSTNIKATADVSNSVKRLLLMLLATTDYFPLPWSPKLYRLQTVHKPQNRCRDSHWVEFILCRCVCHHCSNACLFWNKIQCTLHVINWVIDWRQFSVTVCSFMLYKFYRFKIKCWSCLFHDAVP